MADEVSSIYTVADVKEVHAHTLNPENQTTNKQEANKSEALSPVRSVGNLYSIMTQNNWVNETTLFTLYEQATALSDDEKIELMDVLVEKELPKDVFLETMKQARQLHMRVGTQILNNTGTGPMNFRPLETVHISDGNERAVANTQRQLTESIIKRIEIGEITPLSETMQEFDRQAQSYLRDHFKACGVKTDVEFPQLIVQTPLEKTRNFTTLGERKPGIVEIAELEITDEELKNYLQAKEIVHERYHAAAGINVTRTNDPFSPYYRIDRQGLSYESSRYDIYETSPLEEGLATIATLRAEKFISEAFPEGKKKHEKIVSVLSAKYPGIPKELISISGIKGEIDYDNLSEDDLGNIKWHINGHSNSYAFTKYLEGQVGANSFMKLTEQARIDGDTIALARELERRFGTGTFRQIVLADETNLLNTVYALEKGKSQILLAKMFSDMTNRVKSKFDSQEEWRDYYNEELERLRNEKVFSEGYIKNRQTDQRKYKYTDTRHREYEENKQPPFEKNDAKQEQEPIIDVVRNIALEKLDPDVLTQMRNMEDEGMNPKAIFRKLAIQYHPDKKSPDDPTRARGEAIFKQLVDLQDSGYFGHKVKNVKY